MKQCKILCKQGETGKHASLKYAEKRLYYVETCAFFVYEQGRGEANERIYLCYYR